MSAESINKIVEQLTQIPEPDLGAFQEALGAKPSPTKENPKWSMFELDLKHPSFDHADLRLAKSGSAALLSLWTPESNGTSEEDLDLTSWGEPVSIDINPRIPPEGTVAYVYLVNDVRVAVQMTHTSRKLRSLALEWPGG